MDPAGSRRVTIGLDEFLAGLAEFRGRFGNDAEFTRRSVMIEARRE